MRYNTPMQELFFVTTNQAKFDSLARRFQQLPIALKQHSTELNELQLMTGEAIIRHKLQQAKKLLPGKAVLVDDRGFSIPALNGFPGPLVKPVLQTLGIGGILKLMEDQTDRRASFISTLGLFDGQQDHYFMDEEPGVIVHEPRGENLRGWTELLLIYSPAEFPGKTLAEISNEEWHQHIASQTKNDCRRQLMEFLQK